MTKLPILFLFLFICSISGYAQTWEVPAEQKAKTAPFLFDKTTVEQGKDIYQRNCQSCHGTPGQGNVAKLTPLPKDPTTKEFQANTDGEFHYKITTGRSLMPSFSNSLSNEQRWQVISFIRSFNKSYKQAPINSTGGSTLKSSVNIHFSILANKLILTLINTDKKTKTDLSNIGIKLFVKRYFGEMQIGESVTNTEGKATFDYTKLLGDTLGNITLLAKLTMSNGNEFSQEKQMKIGQPIHPTKLLDLRTMWNVRAKTPIWLLITYIGGVLSVGAVLLYIMLQLKKINDMNSKKQNL